MKEYEVWMEGYVATGERGKHRLVGKYEAESFPEACKKAALDLARGDIPTYYRYFDEKKNSWWACRFFDNEADSMEFDY